MTRIRRLLIALAVLLMLVVGCQTAQEQATPTPIPTPIVPEKPTYTVQRGTVQRILQFTARVSPVVEEELFFRMGGYVKKVYFERDAAVKKGDLIAELEIEGLLNQLAQAQVNLEKAQLTLTAAQESNTRELAEAKIGLEVKRLRVEKAKAQNPNWSVVIAKARVSEAEVAVQQAQAAYDRISWQPGLEATSAARALQAATTALEIAKANYQIALQSQKAYEYDLKILEKDLELAQSQCSWLEKGVDPNLVKAVEQAQLGVQRLEGQVADGRIVSPIDGVVTNISIYEGRAAEAFKPVVVVANMEEVEITAQLPEADMSELKVGMPVTVTLTNYPGQAWTGVIAQLPYPYGTGGSAQQLEKADPYTHIALDNPGVEMKVGDTAKVSVLLEQADDTLYLPPAAIRTFEGRNFVVIQAEGRQRRIDIKVGIKGADRVELLEGLAEGQVVVGQ